MSQKPPKTSQATVQLAEAQEKAARALADYQNLVRRTQEDRAKLVRMANAELISALLQPLEHLELAAQQSGEQGVAMVLEQFKKALAEFGLEEIAVLGQDFDVVTMEAVEGSIQGKKVKTVVQKGYKLNGQIIQHAKVILA